MPFMSRLAALTAAALLSVSSAQAQSLQDGIDAWLADDDATALPILSQQANDGDRDARMLLGQIEAVTPPGAGSSFVTGLDRRERISLLRSEGGLSGTSWTRVLQNEGDPLAAALMDARLPDADLDTAAYLVEQGEVEAGSALAWQIFDRGRWDEIFALSPDDPLLQQLDFIAWMRHYFSNPPTLNAWNWLEDSPANGRSGGVMMMTLVAPVLAPHLRPSEDMRHYVEALRGSPGTLLENSEIISASDVMHQQLLEDANLTTVRTYCEQTCPDSLGYCGLQVIAATGGADRIKLHDTPYEALIAQDVFATSPRAVAELRRWMASLSGTLDMIGRATVSECVSNDIATLVSIQ